MPSPTPTTLFELGSGGGNNASFLCKRFTCTLSDLSPQMLTLSRALNPDAEHVLGDMRTLRLGRTFDAVFVHDAVMYMATEDDLRSCMETAFAHTRPGGAALFAPDCTRETFAPGTDHGGHDGDDGRALRYLEWTHEPGPGESSFAVDYVVLLTRARRGRSRRPRPSPPRALRRAHLALPARRRRGFAAHRRPGQPGARGRGRSRSSWGAGHPPSDESVTRSARPDRGPRRLDVTARSVRTSASSEPNTASSRSRSHSSTTSREP